MLQSIRVESSLTERGVYVVACNAYFQRLGTQGNLDSISCCSDCYSCCFVAFATRFQIKQTDE